MVTKEEMDAYEIFEKHGSKAKHQTDLANKALKVEKGLVKEISELKARFLEDSLILSEILYSTEIDEILERLTEILTKINSNSALASQKRIEYGEAMTRRSEHLDVIRNLDKIYITTVEEYLFADMEVLAAEVWIRPDVDDGTRGKIFVQARTRSTYCWGIMGRVPNVEY